MADGSWSRIIAELLDDEQPDRSPDISISSQYIVLAIRSHHSSMEHWEEAKDARDGNCAEIAGTEQAESLAISWWTYYAWRSVPNGTLDGAIALIEHSDHHNVRNKPECLTSARQKSLAAHSRFRILFQLTS
ncbi:hypothetical protein BJ742DRAFT_733854 [Cladochytrium replicatum]|nr:hypothetical protein BJ742DRAFT_733854 [Cladochytrium replicatum]